MPAASKKTARKKASSKARRPVQSMKAHTEPATGPVVLMPHQLDALAHFDAGQRFQYHAWHRRAGKDWFGMYLGAREFEQNPGTYWHLLPKHVQARRAIWHGVDHVSGRRFMDIFFGDLAAGVNNTDMFVEGENGSTWQLLGSDNYDRMVGANPRGVIFSEWALCDPRAWDYIRPILRANGGWAIFISTFRGRNHAYQLFERVRNNPEWYVTLKTITDTGIITPAQVEADRVSGMSDRLIDQEYYCKTVPPMDLGPYARAFAALQEIDGVYDLPDTARLNSERYIAIGVHDDYTATVECSVRNSRVYLHGGRIARWQGATELLSADLSAIRMGTKTLVGALAGSHKLPENLPFVQAAQAPDHEACTLIEKSIISPSSIVAAACTASLGPWLDEDVDGEPRATRAVYAALESLAEALKSVDWGAPLTYNRHDSAVIGRHPKWR